MPSKLRAGEMAALRVGDLDLTRGRLHVCYAVAEVHGKLETGSPKSGRERTVSIPPFLRDMLTTQVAARAEDPEALVFTTEDGSQIRISDFAPIFALRALSNSARQEREPKTARIPAVAGILRGRAERI